MEKKSTEDVLRDELNKITKAKENIKSGIAAFIAAFIRLFLETWIIQIIWNDVVVDNFNVNKLSYWDALALFLMVRLLVGQIKIGVNKDKNK